MIKKERTTGGRLLRSLLLLTLALLMALCFVACAHDGEEGSDEVVENSAIAALLKDTLGTYQVVRPETMKGDELKAVLSFVDVLQQNGYPELMMVSDYVALAPIIETELVIGETTRKGSEYTEGEGIIEQTESYTVAIVEKRLIFTYTDTKGLVDGLEYLLFSVLDGEQADIRETYNMELFERGVKRYSNDSFAMKNYIGDGSVYSADKDITFIGTSTPDSTVSIQLTKGYKTLDSFDAVTDAKGVWKTSVTPNTEADSIIVRIDGNLAERYEDITFKSEKINACSEGTKVYINGEQVNVHANEGGNYVVSSLDKDETEMEIKLVRRYAVDVCDVRPLSAGVEPDINGKEITFTVTEFPCKLSVEFDDFFDDPFDSVQLFLYAHEEFVPDLEEKDLVYFAPGEYWVDEDITLPSSTTVYIEEGAVLHGRFDFRNAHDITIMGRGIIDTYYFKTETNMMVFDSCRNITLKDYTLTGPRKWMTVLKECNNCIVDTVNILGTEMNSDGVDIVGSQNVTVKDCFLRTNDDGIAVKSHNSDVKNVKVTGCIFWNERYGNALEIGYETRCNNISDVTFEDNDLIHVSGACMSIHLGDRANVSNVKYRDIRIENANGKLIDYFIKTTQYTIDTERGTISNVSFEGIEVLGDTLGRIVLEGYDETHKISNISIGKIKYNGRYLDDISSIVSKGGYVENITYNGEAV